MHALVIGVGDYDYLYGGARYEPRPAPPVLALGQLTSPQASALAFASWLRSSYSNRHAPFGSIELLVSSDSDTPKGGTSFPAEGTTLAEIREAFARWRARCDAHRDNIAIFYFSGHGVEGLNSFLLPSDFGADALAPFERAIDFTSTFRGMEHCRADTQLYFIDACRYLSQEAVGQHGAVLASFRHDIPPYGRSAAPIYRATALGTGAQGAPRQPSLFTSTLLRCLEEFGAECEQNGRWTISTATLGPALVRLMERVRPGSQSGMCQGDYGPARVIHEIERPLVLASVTCNPAGALASAELRARRNSPPWEVERAPDPAPWYIELEPGIYDVGAFFEDGVFTSGWHQRERIVVPPYFACELDV
jgi:Caspase domain